MDIILNPMILSVVLMIVLCLLKVDVFISIMVSALACTIFSGTNISDGMWTFINGMGNNNEIVYCILMFGILGYAMEEVNIGEVLVPRVSKVVGNKIWLIPIALFIMGAISETFILIYVGFVPIFIPPLIKLFNKYKVDRRMLVTVIMAGMQLGYVCVPVGFGRMFMEIVQGELATNGLEVDFPQVWHANLVIAVSLLVAVAAAMIAYRKPRDYGEEIIEVEEAPKELLKVEFKHWVCIASALVAVVIQVLTENMPLAATCSVALLVICGVIPPLQLNKAFMGSVKTMGYTALVLMSASGYASVTREIGELDTLVGAVAALTGGSKLIGAILMLILGLMVTLGIGSAWSTVPIVATVLVPLGLAVNMSPAAIIMLVAAAGALGDSGSPASDQTLVPTASFNIDGKHDHIRDTCIPSFLCVNVPILIICAIAAIII